MKSLDTIDSSFPKPKVIEILKDKRNIHLLRYVSSDAFGAHVFPGNIPNYPQQNFLHDINAQLKDEKPIHLWTNIPLCENRCHFCQFPVITLNNSNKDQLSRWVDASIYEAKLWLQYVPLLKSVTIGAFNLFGGTPSILPKSELGRLLDFYQANFNFDSETILRSEGTPKTLTKDYLFFLKQRGFNTVSFGVQSFSNIVLKSCNCAQTADDCIQTIINAQSLGFDRVSADLIYGLLDQTVQSVNDDIDKIINLKLPIVVCAKLHLKTYNVAKTSISGLKPAAWQDITYRIKLLEDGHYWPSLGEQYQMRETIVSKLHKAGFREHPLMYFIKNEYPTEKWKALTVDQDKQHVEVAIGLGASSCCQTAESSNEIDAEKYFTKLKNDQLPLKIIRGFDQAGQEKKSVKMALSTCQPLSDKIHRTHFPESSLFNEYWQQKFTSLQKRHLAVIDNKRRMISLTEEGKSLAEALINTELS